MTAASFFKSASSRNMVENPYIQFPLCALSFGQTVTVRLNAILDYGVVEAGSRLFRKLTAEQHRQFLVKRRQDGKIPQGFDKNNWLHNAALYGAHVIGVNYSDFGSIMERHRTLYVHIADFEQRHGRDAKVRIK